MFNIHLLCQTLLFPGALLTLSLFHTFSIYFTMATTNDHPLSLSNDYASNDSSSLVRAYASSSSESHCLVNNQSILVVILVSDDSKLERFSSGFLGREASFNESSFNALFSDEDVGDDHVVISMLASSEVTRAFSSVALIT